MRKKVLLSSGGMDSFLLAHELELEGALHLFVNVGQEYGRKEWAAAQFAADCAGAEIKTIQVSDMAQFEHKQTGIIPFRNAELILCAAQFGEDIYLGVIADEVNSDKSPEFLAAMKTVLDISHRAQYWTEGREFQLKTPFRGYTKTELVKRYVAAGYPLPNLFKTVSCYDGGDVHCGRCSSCFKRWVALTVGLGQDAADPATPVHPWARHPGMWQTRTYWMQKLATYAPRRRREVMVALDIAGIP